MGYLVYLSLVALISCETQGASLPYKGGYEFHFDKMGVRLDLAMKDINPLVGGKAHIELPISAVWKLLEVDHSLLKPIIIVLEKTTFGRIYDVLTVKADISFNAEDTLEGIFNVSVDYTLVHKDGSEEKASILIQGKRSEAGKLITTLEIIPKTNVVIPEKIFSPLEMILTCNWPSAHTLTIKGEFGKIFLNIATDMNDIFVRGVWEYLGQQYKYSTLLSIKEKSFTATYQEPNKEVYDIVMMVKVFNGFPMVEITGKAPATPWFTAGNFTTKVFVTNINYFNFKISHIFNGVEILSFFIANFNKKIEIFVKYGLTHQAIVLHYEYMRWIKIGFPNTGYANTWLSKDLGIEMHYQPTNEAKQLEGGNIKIVVMRDKKPIMNAGGYFGLTLDSTKYEILLNDLHINMLKQEKIVINGVTFSELRFYGKILLDRLHMNKIDRLERYLLPKISVEAKIHKDEKLVFLYLLTSIEAPCKLHVFFPYLFQDILNLAEGHIEITHEDVVLGNKRVITTLCNLTAKKLIATVTPTMTTIELFDGEVSIVKYVAELEPKLPLLNE